MIEKTVPENLTPMMKHWHEVKARYPDYIIFYRLGDFYEMFEQDALEASAILNIVLTKRQTTPMCGVPYHACKLYLKKLIGAGRKVIICEQLEDPKTSKGMVKRGVTEIVTPGTILADDFLNEDSNFIMAVIPPSLAQDAREGDSGRANAKKKSKGLANDAGSAGNAAIICCDISTGELFIEEMPDADSHEVLDELTKLRPAEVVLPAAVGETSFAASVKEFTFLSLWSGSLPDSEKAEEIICRFLNISTVRGLGLRSGSALTGLALLSQYLQDNEIRTLPQLKGVSIKSRSSFLELDGQTMKNLEIVESWQSDGRTLLSAIDRTKTPMGRRALRQRMLFPRKDGETIEKRLGEIDSLLGNQEFLSAVRENLGQIRDLERLYGKIAMGKGGAQDLILFKYSILYAKTLSVLCENARHTFAPVSDNCVSFADLIGDAICDDAPRQGYDGRIIREGFNAELDEYYLLDRDASTLLVEYQERIKKETGISNLRIKYNKVFGYFFEVSKGSVAKVPESFMRKQTLTTAERYTTEVLIEYEGKIAGAKEKIEELSRRILGEIVGRSVVLAGDIEGLCEGIAELDTAASMADLAREYRWTRPVLTDGRTIEIVDGRHPVLEQKLGGEFVPNSLFMDERAYFHVITGPNMSGKSTYLRQCALLLYLVHVGSYVPAERLVTYTLDAMFSRIGASDDLARGYSTFLVEMSETARIVNRATSRSFVILDEVGRGTATFDGMSLAYAISEHLLTELRCAVLFATHYHELTLLSEFAGVQNRHLEVREYNGKIFFLKKVMEGFSDKSYGIYVASIAGLPERIVKRATELLGILEQNEILFERKSEKLPGADRKRKKVEVTLFDDENNENDITERLRNADPDMMTPIDALLLVRELKSMLNGRNV